MSYVQNILKGSSTCANGTEEVAINKPELVLDATFIQATQRRNCSQVTKNTISAQDCCVF